MIIDKKFSFSWGEYKVGKRQDQEENDTRGKGTKGVFLKSKKGDLPGWAKQLGSHQRRRVMPPLLPVA